MKKILPIVVIIILVLSGLGAVAAHVSTDSQLLDDKTEAASFYDELDQSQTEMTENAVLPVGQVPVPDDPINVQVAQSFIPTKEILTRVEIYIGKNSTATHPYIVAIRDNLTKEDLTQTSVDSEDIPTEEFGWIEFDFEDIKVTTGQTYYIVSYTMNTTDNFYAWGANNISESYPYECAWVSIDDGITWGNESASSHPSNVEEWVNKVKAGQTRPDDPGTWDTCFKTYGRGNFPPETPEITGQASGTAGIEYDYIITSEDPDGDPIFYKINWSDGDVVEWFGPFDSGDPQTVSHSWNVQGDYTIRVKAKDIYGAESDWGELRITMPRSRAINSLFLQFLQQFPILRLLLQRLGL